MPRKQRVVALGSVIVVLCATAALDTGAPATAQDAEAKQRTFEQIVSAPLIPAKTDGRNLTCYVTNIGDQPVKLKSVRLLDTDGKRLEPGYETCGKTLNGRKTCGVGWDYVGYVAVHCDAKVDDARNVRGRLELRKDGQVEAATSFR